MKHYLVILISILFVLSSCAKQEEEYKVVAVDTFTTIALGDVRRVIDDTKAHLDSTSKIENMIFTCSCSVDRGLSHEKIKTMIDTVKGYRS